jgi:hypothetical protein
MAYSLEKKLFNKHIRQLFASESHQVAKITVPLGNSYISSVLSVTKFTTVSALPHPISAK